MDTLHIGIQITAVLIAALSFFLLLSISLNYHPAKLVAETYEKFYDQLKEQRKGWFDYEKIQAFLNQKGATYHIGQKMNPIRFYAAKIVIAVVCVVYGARYHYLVSILLAIVGFQAPKMYMVYINKQDNEVMLPEINLLFNTLSLQIRSGVNVVDALTECYGNVTDKRLRNALIDLSGELILNADLRTALANFQGKFDDRYIDSFCIIILQAMESGQAVDLLADISEQIKDMESVVLQKKKAALDRKVTFYMLGIMAIMIAVVIYACVLQMFSAASIF